MRLYKFEIVRLCRKDITYIYASSLVEACRIFDTKHVGYFKFVHALLEDVIMSSKDTGKRGCWGL